MMCVTVDPATARQLQKTCNIVEIRDDSGHLLGLFVPVLDQFSKLKAEPTISEEELQRREKMGGGRNLADILADLRSN